MVTKMSYLLKWTDICLRDMTETIQVQQTECQKEFRWERRILWSIVSKAAQRFNKRRTEMLSLSRAERLLFTICNKMVSVLCPAR